MTPTSQNPNNPEIRRKNAKQLQTFKPTSQNEELREILDAHFGNMELGINGAVESLEKFIASEKKLLLDRLLEKKEITRVWDGKELSTNFVEAVPLETIQAERDKL